MKILRKILGISLLLACFISILSVIAFSDSEEDNSPVVYDFENGIISNDDFRMIMYVRDASTPAASSDIINLVDLFDVYEDDNDYATTYANYYGSLLSLVTDPQNSYNDVLKIKTKSMSSGTVNSYLQLSGVAEYEEDVHAVVKFDFYYDSASNANKEPLNIHFYAANGDSVFKSNFIKTYSTSGYDSYYFAGSANNVLLEYDNWYTFMFVLSRNDGSSNGNTLNVYYSANGGLTYTLAATSTTNSLTASGANGLGISRDYTADIAYVNIETANYNIGTNNMYIDNLSYGVLNSIDIPITPAIAIESVNNEDDLIEDELLDLTRKISTLDARGASISEILVGDVGENVSDTAYNMLNAYVEENYSDLEELREDGKGAYLIYVNEGALAIAYTDLYARGAALNYLYNNLTTLTPGNGLYARDTVDILEFIAYYREATIEEAFTSLGEEMSADTVEALLNVYSLYDEDLYIWLANLYDPDIGGFYYSNSARDNTGFLPDLESTRQALSTLESSGLANVYSDSWVNMLPDNIKTNIASFVRGLQSYKDGYFYHPQWGTVISTTRRSRDLSAATGILSALGVIPKYDTPNNIEGEYDIGTEVTPTVAKWALTQRLGGSASTAVSKVVAASTTSSYLDSEEAFIEYLESLENSMAQNSYSIGNLLNAQVGEINSAGYHSILIEYLNDWQKENGLWEDSITYQSINGLMKISAMYYTYELKAGGKALASLNSMMALLLSELDENGELTDEALAEVEGITYVYNPWVAMQKLIGALTTSEKTSFKVTLNANSSALINGTYRKLQIFKKSDGGFSYNVNSSSYTSQSALVAIANTPESDVNATSIAISTVFTYMLPVFDISEGNAPDLFTKYDSAHFLENLLAVDTVEKITYLVTPENISFDNSTSQSGELGVVISPDESVKNNVGDKETENGEYKWFQSEIVDNPDGTVGDKVLFAGDYVYSDAENNIIEATTQSSTDFYITNASVDGNCYIFDADIYFDSINSGTGTVAQICFATRIATSTHQSTSFELTTYTSGGNTYLMLTEATYYLGSDAINSTIATAIPVDEWFNLRLELYREYSEDGKAITSSYVKVYVDEELKGTVETGRYTSGAYLNYPIDCVRVGYVKNNSSAFYFNNVYAAKVDTESANSN